MFSVREEKIIEIIGKKKMNYSEIAAKLFNYNHVVPFDAEISVGNSIRRIIKKCEHRKLKWTLVKKRTNGKLLISKGKV